MVILMIFIVYDHFILWKYTGIEVLGPLPVILERHLMVGTGSHHQCRFLKIQYS